MSRSGPPAKGSWISWRYPDGSTGVGQITRFTDGMVYIVKVSATVAAFVHPHHMIDILESRTHRG